MRKIIEIEKDHHVVVCDKLGCDYEEFYSESSLLKTYINKPCPKCGENLLTEKDYKDYQILMGTINFINKWFSWLTVFFPKHVKMYEGDIKVHEGYHIKIDDKL